MRISNIRSLKLSSFLRVSSFKFRISSVLIFTVVPLSTSAQILHITPKIVDSSDQVESRLSANTGRAQTSIEGAGSHLLVEYFASDPVDFFMVPLDADQSYVPTDFITFTLSATDAAQTRIDLTVSPGWHPGDTTWLINLLSKDDSTNAGFLSIEFERATLTTSLGAAIGHFFTPEAYTPSSYHALRGYRVLGNSFTILFGVLLLVVVFGAAFIMRPQKKISTSILLILIALFLYEARFALDLVRFSTEHLKGYAASNYDEAGSVYDIAHDIRIVQSESELSSVYVCKSGTNFKEKLLRYFAYPVPIQSDGFDGSGADLIVVMDAFDWTVIERTEDDRSINSLTCNNFFGDVEKLKTYTDGSQLFRSLQ